MHLQRNQSSSLLLIYLYFNEYCLEQNEREKTIIHSTKATKFPLIAKLDLYGMA